jgi:hypothetical protein
MLFSKAQFGLVGNTIATRFRLMSLRTKVLFAAVICLVVGVIVATMPGSAATPSSGTLTDTSGPLSYTAGPFNVANATPLPQGVDAGPRCNNPAQPCDDFALTVTLPAGYLALHPNVSAKVTLSWTDTSGQSASDYDLYIYKGTVTTTNGSQVAFKQSSSSRNPEIATISPLVDGSQTFTVKVVPYTPSQEIVSVRIELLTGSSTPSPSPGLPGSGPNVPRFFNYASPQGIANSVGEPSIGSNWKSEKTFSNSMFSIPNGGTALLFGGFSPSLARITFDDCSSPAGALWEAKPLLTANSPRVFGDPILFTDHETGRTFVSQLEGLTPAGSTTDITDNDGDSFTPSEGSGLPSCVDHQTIGGGPFHAPLTGLDPVYPNAVYYASQCVADATASLSLDGGRTFGPGSVMYTTADCGGLHGHLKVAPDGTAYVPNNACGGTADPIGHVDGNQAVIVSEDNGLTWSIRKIPGSTTKSSHDGSVAVASDSNTIYEGFQSGDGHPRIAVSHDKGLHWSVPFDVGTTVIGGGPILNTGFAAVVAGDPNRASFAFYGTVTGGNDWNTPGFAGEWFLYVASTFDGGATWTTQNLTPGDPIQRGGICGSGACRNHLDFFDATIDKEGRVVIGYTDGCVSASCISGGSNDNTAKGTIARQTGGRRMFVANDPIEPVIPGAPLVGGSVNGANTVASLSWPAPDDGGSPITAYKISRGPSATGPFTLIATVLGTKNNYADTTFDPSIQNFYIVTAVNAIGEGPYCHPFHPLVVVLESACDLPGLTILTDQAGDIVTPSGQTTNPGWDVRSLSIAEPLAFAPNKVVFTLKVQSLATVPPDTRWPVTFNVGTPAVNYTVRMTNSPVDGATTAPIFQVGRTTTTTPPAAEPFTAADPASNFNADGTITIVVPTSKIGNPTVGQNLTGFLTRITVTAPPNPQTSGVTPDNMPDSLTPTGSYTIIGNIACVTPTPTPTPTPTCLEDNDARIAYSNGWHLIDDASASDRHFRYHSGNSPQHFASLDFNVPTGNTGTITYYFAKSPKGGSADVYLDGVFNQTIDYNGKVGSTQAPEFNDYKLQIQTIPAGDHTLAIKNLSGVVYVDRFCLENSSSNAQTATGPGDTTNQSSTASVGQTSSSNYQMQSGSQEVSVVAESSVNVPFKLALVNPTGLTLQTVDAVNGTAVLNASVTQTGVYVIKVINVSLGPLQFTTTVTPLVSR